MNWSKMMRHLGLGMLLAVVVLLTLPVRAAEKDLVQATLLADTEAAVPGGSFTLGVRMVLKPQWHTYWVDAGESGDPTKVKMSGPAGFEFGEIQWPLPHKIDAPGGFSYGYENEVLLLIPVKVAKTVAVGTPVTLTASATWLTCKDTCIEGGAKLAIELPVSGNAKPANGELFDAWRARLPLSREKSVAPDAPATVAQPSAADGAPLPSLTVNWKAAPKKVEFFPISTPGAAIENVVVKQDGVKSVVTFKTTVFKAEKVVNGRLDGLLVYEDEQGRRQGMMTSVRVNK